MADQHFAANKVFLNKNSYCRNTVVKRDKNDIVTELLSLDDQQVEPAATIFLNGIITPEVDTMRIAGGVPLADIITGNIATGRHTKLLYWNGISTENPIITSNTTYKEI